jgi:hypothetical protein
MLARPVAAYGPLVLFGKCRVMGWGVEFCETTPPVRGKLAGVATGEAQQEGARCLGAAPSLNFYMLRK